MPAEIREALGPGIADVREIFLRPEVTEEYSTEVALPDHDGLVRFLCDEREFSRERVIAAIDRAFPKSSRA